MSASDGKLVGHVRGEVGKDEGVLVIQRIHVRYTLEADRADQATIERAFEAHPPRCPVYRTLSGCIEITTELDAVYG